MTRQKLQMILPASRFAPGRRALIGTALAGGFLASCSKSATGAAAPSGPPVAETSFGMIQGSVEKGVGVFKGAPYGASDAPPKQRKRMLAIGSQQHQGREAAPT